MNKIFHISYTHAFQNREPIVSKNHLDYLWRIYSVQKKNIFLLPRHYNCIYFHVLWIFHHHSSCTTLLWIHGFMPPLLFYLFGLSNLRHLRANEEFCLGNLPHSILSTSSFHCSLYWYIYNLLLILLKRIQLSGVRVTGSLKFFS